MPYTLPPRFGVVLLVLFASIAVGLNIEGKEGEAPEVFTHTDISPVAM